MDPIRLKTVYDATRADPTGMLAAQVRLHVASWRAHVTSAAGLTVTCVGEPSPALTDDLIALGADLEVCPHPHRLAFRSPTYNKHLAASEDGSERVFLADNDTVYVADVAALADVPRHCVAASTADRQRIPPALWERLRAAADIRVIRLDWVPWKERARAERKGRAPVWERYAYFNSGAVLFPPGGEFWDLWETETERMSAYLAAWGMDDRKDVGSDQLSLTSAAAVYGAWQLLPAGFNVRPFHFWISDLAMEEVVQLHLVATERVRRRVVGRVSLTALLRRYWQMMVLAGAVPDKRPLADSLLDKLVAVVANYDLDEI